MAYCCSQCDFTAQFESALMMHRQLHHESSASDDHPIPGSPNLLREKFNTVPRTRISPPSSPFTRTKNKEPKLLSRTSSATRLLGKLKARICKSRTLFAHPEEGSPESTVIINHLSAPSECTSKALKASSIASRASAITACVEERKESFGCHLCPFDADRITVLDRHLLNHHKIGLENLLKLVMAKTRDGLTEEHNSIIYGIRQPYYRLENEIIEEGEFIIETVTPKVKILKHAATNTDRGNNVEEFGSNKDSSIEKNCQIISKEIESLLNGDKTENADFLSKMQSLNDCMCKFVDSSNAVKKMLTKELDSKSNVKEHLNGEPYYNLGLGDRETPRNWERGAYSEKMERSRNQCGENCRADKSKPSAESFYY